jgi:uncharacterized protein (DUF58 family)
MLSRESLVFILLLTSIALAGLNSGNNLLYLVSGVMLGALVVSPIAGWMNMSKIKADRRLPRQAFAGHPFKIIVEISNDKKLLRSFGVSLREEAAADEEESAFLFSLGGGEERVEQKSVTLKNRGTHKFGPVVIRSSFPFGLFEMKRTACPEYEMIVYPHIWDISRPPQGSSQIRDEFPTHLKGPGSGLYGFREYRHGEEATNISWKLSAKIGRLIIRETEHEEKRRVCLVFDNVLKDAPTKEASAAALEEFEKAVSYAASLAWYLGENGFLVKLITRDKVVGYGSGPKHMHKMLTILALIQSLPADGQPPVANRAALEGGIGVLVSSAGSATLAGKRPGDFKAMPPAKRVREGRGAER